MIHLLIHKNPLRIFPYGDAKTTAVLSFLPSFLSLLQRSKFNSNPLIRLPSLPALPPRLVSCVVSPRHNEHCERVLICLSWEEKLQLSQCHQSPWRGGFPSHGFLLCKEPYHRHKHNRVPICYCSSMSLG